jgi:uncharacterized membrane protein
MKSRPAMTGFFLAPALLPLSAFVFIVLNDFQVESLTTGLVYAGLFSMFTYPVALVLGLPLHLLMQRHGWLSIEQYAAGGAVLGIAPLLFWGAFGNIDALFLLFCCAVGAASAIVFWLMAVRS